MNVRMNEADISRVAGFLRHPLAVPLLLVAAVAITFANSFPGVFIQDDLYIVRDNPLVAHLDLWRIATSEYWHGIESNGLYRPLTILSLALNRLLLGAEPLGFHLVNVLLHAAVTVLLYHLLLRWGGGRTAALVAALLFAVHPIHAEVINIVVGRAELLAALFLLLALIAADCQGWWAVTGTALAFLAALLAKEHALVLLVLLPLRDLYTTRSLRGLRPRLTIYLPLLAVAVAWLLWRQFGVVHDLPPSILPPEVVPLAALSWDGRVVSALLLQGLYLGKLLVPTALQAVYAPADLPPIIASVVSLRGILVLGGAALLAAGVVMAWRRAHRVALFVGLYFASFALTANVLFPLGVTFAERLSYFPSGWFCAGVGVVAGAWYDSSRGRLLSSLVIAGTLVLAAGVTIARNPDFSSEERYWGADVRRNPEDYLALVKYAELLAAAGAQEESEAAFRRVLQLAPTFAYGYRSYAGYLAYLRREDEALAASRRAMELAREHNDTSSLAHDLGDQARIFLERRDYHQALALLDEAARLVGRDDFEAELRARAQAGQGRSAGAVTPHVPGTPPVAVERQLYDQALADFRAGRKEEARVTLEQLTREPGAGAESWNLLGVVCGELNDAPCAFRAFREALRLAPANPYYAENLQAAERELRP